MQLVLNILKMYFKTDNTSVKQKKIGIEIWSSTRTTHFRDVNSLINYLIKSRKKKYHSFFWKLLNSLSSSSFWFVSSISKTEISPFQLQDIALQSNITSLQFPFSLLNFSRISGYIPSIIVHMLLPNLAITPTGVN